MITVKIDKTKFAEALKNKFQNIIDPTSTIYRQLATDLIPIIQERIHVKGLAADGKEIGIYSNAYIKMRTGNYSNADKVAKGKNAGKNKNAGVSRKGSARKMYNRNSDPKVILSLTRQLENDYAVIGTGRGWGIGFNNQHNADKAKWNNRRYGRLIYDLTKSEIEYSTGLIDHLIKKEFE